MIRWFAVLSSIFISCLASAGVFHVDALKGDDADSGASPDHAWRSLEKVNATTLKPGDRVLFKSGCRWTGCLKPTGSGSDETMISIGRYGEGPLPRIDGEGRFPDALLLRNVSCIRIADLEITNLGASPSPWRTGVRLLADGIGKMRRVHLSGLSVRDVNGDLRKSHEGCGIFFEAARGNDSHFDGLLIENCHVARTDRNGICQRGTGKVRSRNVIIRGNLLEDIGGDGIKLWGTNGGLIEKNVVRKARARCGPKEAAAGIWPFACDDTVIQFNEVSGTMGTTDGQGYDADYNCRRSLFQYNYSHGNEGGFMLVCAPGNAVNEDTVIRYNISVHDGVNSARVFHFGGGARRTRIYQNTIVVGASQNLPLLLFTEWNKGNAADTRFTNNLFIVEEGGRATYQFGKSSGTVFEGNWFCGRHEKLPAGVTVSPLPRFAGALVAKPGFDSLNAFRPASGAVFPRGRVVENNGGRDILGHPVPRDKAPAIGALEPLR